MWLRAYRKSPGRCASNLPIRKIRSSAIGELILRVAHGAAFGLEIRGQQAINLQEAGARQFYVSVVDRQLSLGYMAPKDIAELIENIGAELVAEVACIESALFQL